MDRNLLIVDDEINIISSLSRLLRRDGYKIYKANSAKEGMDVLADNDVGVIISDQRMPETTGTEFLNNVKELYPDTVRIVLSGYTDLNTITEAINQGYIYKFLTKPWDDDLIRKNILEAFDHYELKQENVRLNKDLKIAYDDLAKLNSDLEKRVILKTKELTLNIKALQFSQYILENLPAAIIGYSNDGNIAISNNKADTWLNQNNGSLIGKNISDVIPGNKHRDGKYNNNNESNNIVIKGDNYQIYDTDFSINGLSSGRIIMITKDQLE